MRTWQRILRASVLGVWSITMASAVEPALTGEAPAKFWRRPELQQPIEVGTLNRPLLIAAIFNETNRRRAAEKLPPLLSLDQLNDAADLQAAVLAVGLATAHENPHKGQETAWDRVRSTGLEPRWVAENVAILTMLVLPKTGDVFERSEAGRRILSASPDGPGLPPHTYASFAAELVENWMNSPHHRANILNPQLRYLGCACRPGKALNGMETLHAVQVFFTPQTAGAKADP